MKEIPVTEVKSSQIKAHGYDAETETLRIVFNPKKDGKCSRYDYHNVPPEIAQGFADAESVGRYFGANVKKAAYKFDKLPDLEPVAACVNCDGRDHTQKDCPEEFMGIYPGEGGIV